METTKFRFAEILPTLRCLLIMSNQVKVYRTTAKGVRVLDFQGPADEYQAREELGFYNVVRMYAWSNKRIIKRGLTLAEAQAHCKDPETSSSTCTKSAGKTRTRRMGPWFDGYEACKN